MTDFYEHFLQGRRTLDFTTLTIEFLKQLSNIFGSYGLGIIALTVIIRLAMWPLNVSQQRSMKTMQQLQPKMKQIQEEFYENLTNKELIELAANCMSEIQNRPVLIDCLTEMTYIEQRDEYGFIYDKDSFYSFIDDFQKYLACRDEKVIENKSKRK